MPPETGALELRNPVFRTPAAILTVAPIVAMEAALLSLWTVEPFDLMVVLLAMIPAMGLVTALFLSRLTVPTKVLVSRDDVSLLYSGRAVSFSISRVLRSPTVIGPFGGILSFQIEGRLPDACFLTREACDALKSRLAGSDA